MVLISACSKPNDMAGNWGYSNPNDKTNVYSYFEIEKKGEMYFLIWDHGDYVNRTLLIKDGESYPIPEEKTRMAGNKGNTITYDKSEDILYWGDNPLERLSEKYNQFYYADRLIGKWGNENNSISISREKEAVIYLIKYNINGEILEKTGRPSGRQILWQLGKRNWNEIRLDTTSNCLEDKYNELTICGKTVSFWNEHGKSQAIDEGPGNINKMPQKDVDMQYLVEACPTYNVIRLKAYIYYDHDESQKTTYYFNKDDQVTKECNAKPSNGFYYVFGSISNKQGWVRLNDLVDLSGNKLSENSD